MKNNIKSKIVLVTLCVLLGFSMLYFTNYQGNLKTYNQPNIETPNLSQGTEIYTIANVSGHLWSPDGTKVVYVKSPNLERWNCSLWVAERNPFSAELNNHQLISSEVEYSGLLDWKGDWILYMIRREQGTPSSYYGRNELWKIKYDGMNMTQVTFTQTNGIRTEFWNHAYDNRGTAVWGRFIPGTSLVYFHAHNGNGWYETFVCNDDGTDGWYSISYPDNTWVPRLSPTGNKLLWGAQSNHNQPTTFKACNVDGSVRTTIKAFTKEIGVTVLADGNTLIWSDNDNIYAIDMDGTNERTVLDDGHINMQYNYNPSDMQGLIMGSNRSDGNIHIYKINVDGTGIEQLTDGPYLDEYAILSPDGQYLSYLRLPYDFDKGSSTIPYPYEMVVKRLFPVLDSFSDDFESGLSKWQTITGIWHLTNISSAWPDPCHSPIHSMWFGQEATGNYETGFREMGDLISLPFSLTDVHKAILEFYHWREGESGYDFSYVFISTDGINWDLLYYTDAQIAPWQKLSLDISAYTGNIVQLRFFFDTHDNLYNYYRGWLVDDIEVITYDLSHELSVSLEVPSNPEFYNTYSINATVANAGKNDESNVDLLLYLNDVIVDSITLSNLPVGANETINYMWTPTQYGAYNFTAYAPPVPDEEYIENNIESQCTGIASSITGPVAIFRNNLAWNMNSTEEILNKYGIDYTLYSSSDMGTVVLTQYEKVIIESDQDQLFYDTLGPYISWFESYATNGGVLEIHACDGCWHGGYWDDYYLMPGGFDQYHIFTDYVSINLTDHPILLDPYIITEEELDSWLYSTTGYFTTFPSNSKQIMLDSSTSNPVFIELDYGEGTILITMQPLEWAYYWGYSYLLENVVLFNPDSFILTAPDSSSEWEIDTSHYIYWETLGTISNVKLELYKNDVFVMEIISSTPNDGEYGWTIPLGLDDSTQYQIKISDVFKPSTFTFSEYFEIFNPTITITAPDSSSTWETGTSESVYWTSRGSIPNVKLELYLDDVFVMNIIASTPNNGEFFWEIPSSLVESDQYQIKIIDASDPSIYDYSDYFAIEKPPSGEPAIPGYNLYVLIGILSVVSIILFIKRLKKLIK